MFLLGPYHERKFSGGVGVISNSFELFSILTRVPPLYNDLTITCYICFDSYFILMCAQLIFSLTRYEAVIDAYLDGLEASGLNDLSKVTSVASFFVSRVDTLIDKLLEKIGTPEALDLRGKVNQNHMFNFFFLTKTEKVEIC